MSQAITDKPIRVLIADDHAIVRRGLRTLITSQRDMELVGEAVNGTEAVFKARTAQPDVILMDMVMPEMDGATATRAICEKYPQVDWSITTDEVCRTWTSKSKNASAGT